MDQLDDIVKSAMQALEATTPRGYFDELPSRIEARLEGSMQTDSDIDRNPDQDLRVPPMHHSGDEDTGVHDIRALARSAKQRVRRITTQSDVVDPMLSASQSGLHAVALPDPSKMVSLPSFEEARAMAGSTSGAADDLGMARSAAAVSMADEPRATSRGVLGWLWAAGGVAAAATAVFAVVSFGGKGAEPQHAASPASGAEPPAGAGAMPEPSPREDVAHAGVVDLAEPLEDTATGAGIGAAPTIAEPAVVALDDGEVAASGKRGKDDRVSTAVRADKEKDSAGKLKPDAAGDSKGGKTAGGSKADSDKADKAEVKPEVKKGGGAVLGAGDKDELGIGDALTGGRKVEKPSKTELTSRELRDGLGAVAGKAKACYGAHGVSGTVKVKLTVDPDGTISKASASGDFDGTPTGTCVVAALKTASFPAWSGAPMSTTYAVLLSD